MQNIEYKAELRDLTLARTIGRAIGATHEGTFEQTDTYYRAADARFKRREITGGEVHYILYHRRDRTAPKISRYEIMSEEAMHARFGTGEFTPWVTVKKTRELLRLRNVRIHLDHVESLGSFLEFEVQVSSKCNLRRCHDRVRKLREQFAPALGEPISCGYAELMANEA